MEEKNNINNMFGRIFGNKFKIEAKIGQGSFG